MSFFFIEKKNLCIENISQKNNYITPDLGAIEANVSSKREAFGQKFHSIVTIDKPYFSVKLNISCRFIRFVIEM